MQIAARSTQCSWSELLFPSFDATGFSFVRRAGWLFPSLFNRRSSMCARARIAPSRFFDTLLRTKEGFAALRESSSAARAPFGFAKAGLSFVPRAGRLSPSPLDRSSKKYDRARIAPSPLFKHVLRAKEGFTALRESSSLASFRSDLRRRACCSCQGWDGSLLRRWIALQISATEPGSLQRSFHQNSSDPKSGAHCTL